MTGRVCEVHGEWSESGTCRWCEAETPASAYHVSCDVPAVLKDICPTPEERLDEVVKEYHDAFTLIEKTADAYVWRLQMPLRDWLRAPPSWRLDYEDPAYVAELNAAEESRLDTQHAALHWERLERRWATKHGPWTLRDLAQLWHQQFDKVIAQSLKRLEESLYPLLPVPASEPKR